MEHLLNEISWLQFLTTIFVLLCTYYSYLVYAYYPREIRSLFEKKYPKGNNPFHFPGDSESAGPVLPDVLYAAEAQLMEEATENSLDRIAQLVEQIDPIIADMGPGVDFSKLMVALSEVLKGFQDLKTSPYYPSIVELIQTKIEHTGAGVQSEQQISQLWE